MTYRLGSKEDSPFGRFGPTLASAGQCAAESHPLIETVWVQANRYAKQLILEVWWRREVTSTEASETVRAARSAIQPWLDAEGIDDTWHVTARRGRRRSGEAWLQLVPLLRDDCRVTEVRTRWPQEPEYVDRTPKDAPRGMKKASAPKKNGSTPSPLAEEQPRAETKSTHQRRRG